MNTPIHSNELDPAEQKRRAAAKAKAEKLCRMMGFRQVAGKPGWWYHEDCEPDLVFHLTDPQGPVRSAREVLPVLIFEAAQAGASRVRGQIKRALGL